MGPELTVTAPMLMLFALLIEVVFGWSGYLYRWVRHPVVWMGALISVLDRSLNKADFRDASRQVLGALTCIILVSVSIGVALIVSIALPNNFYGYAGEAIVASSLIAARSLYVHVAAVGGALTDEDLDEARSAVSHIVGRDPAQLDSPAIARASLESLAENASDGVIAPLFWGAIFGLPGLAAYKAINTLDSIGCPGRLADCG